MFSPPLHRQRNQFVIDYVKKNKPLKVVDLGCGECSLLKQLKFHRGVQLLVGVDINGAAVKKHMHGVGPLSSDYLLPSYDQLRVELYQGSVTHKDVRVRAFDLVTSIELIEHLALADVKRFSDVLFGYMTPVAAIVSTPNSEFNPLFPGLEGFRHSDHKFEWTRAEFQSWALRVCLEYGYEVEFTGVGLAPPGQQERVGFCSQIGVFHRLGGRVDSNMFSDDAEEAFSYSLLYSINYPSLHDNNILRRVLVSEVLYQAEKLKTEWMEERTGERVDTHTAEGGAANRLRVSEQHMENEGKPTENLAYLTAACGAELKDLVEHCGRGVAEDEEGEDEDKGRQESGRPRRLVSVPLAALWSCSSKVASLSGSLTNLRRLLMDDPDVRLSRDGSAVLLQDRHAEEEDEDLEESGFAETMKCSQSGEDEDWETDV